MDQINFLGGLGVPHSESSSHWRPRFHEQCPTERFMSVKTGCPTSNMEQPLWQALPRPSQQVHEHASGRLVFCVSQLISKGLHRLPKCSELSWVDGRTDRSQSVTIKNQDVLADWPPAYPLLILFLFPLLRPISKSGKPQKNDSKLLGKPKKERLQAADCTCPCSTCPSSSGQPTGSRSSSRRHPATPAVWSIARQQPQSSCYETVEDVELV